MISSILDGGAWTFSNVIVISSRSLPRTSIHIMVKRDKSLSRKVNRLECNRRGMVIIISTAAVFIIIAVTGVTAIAVSSTKELG